jgi:hypothetical protein
MSLLNECTFICKTCNKNYKSKQSLWNHNNKFHNHQKPPNPTKTPQTPTKNHQITPNLSSTNNKYQCEYCLNIFQERIV